MSEELKVQAWSVGGVFAVTVGLAVLLLGLSASIALLKMTFFPVGDRTQLWAWLFIGALLIVLLRRKLA